MDDEGDLLLGQQVIRLLVLIAVLLEGNDLTLLQVNIGISMALVESDILSHGCNGDILLV